jgi:hypothetical protein
MGSQLGLMVHLSVRMYSVNSVGLLVWCRPEGCGRESVPTARTLRTREDRRFCDAYDKFIPTRFVRSSHRLYQPSWTNLADVSLS